MKRLIAAGAAALSLTIVVPVTAHAESAFCKEAKNIKALDSVLDDIDPTSDPKGAAKKLNTAITAVKKFESKAPKGIKKDIGSLRSFMERFDPESVVRMGNERALEGFARQRLFGQGKPSLPCRFGKIRFLCRGFGLHSGLSLVGRISLISAV